MTSAAARLRRGTVILLASNVGGAALSFLLAAVIARSLGEASFGVYAAVSAWIYPLSIIADMGISTLMTRELAAQPALANQMALNALLLRVVIAGGLMLLVLAAAPLLTDQPLVMTGLRLSAPLIVSLPLFSTISAIFKAHDAVHWVLVLNIGMLAVQLPLTGLALAGGGTIMDVTRINVITSLGQLLAAVLVERGFIRLSPLARWPRRSDLLDMLRGAYPFALSAALSAVQMRAAVIALESLTSLAVVGLFAAMARFTDAARLIPNALFGALMPVLSAYRADPAARERLFNRALAGLAAFGGAAVFGCILAGDLVIRLVYGSIFPNGFPVLLLLTLALGFGALRGGYTLYAFAVGREMVVNGVNLISLVVQIGLCALLIPAHGALGAAWAVLLAEGIALAWLAESRRRGA
jgi:O-antigen/teichoic acid export membrane protein